MILAIDPGKNTGWAIWTLDGCLSACGLGVESLVEVLEQVRPQTSLASWRAVYEHPEYQPSRRVSPNDIITLAVRCGVVLGRLSEAFGFSWVPARPSEWKGSVPKGVHQTRYLKVMAPVDRAKLDAALAEHSKKDDIVDACALGHWYYRRLRALW